MQRLSKDGHAHSVTADSIKAVFCLHSVSYSALAIVASAEYWSAVAQAFAPVWLDAVQSPKFWWGAQWSVPGKCHLRGVGSHQGCDRGCFNNIVAE
ncbi:hypothetical protein HaLaN_32926 [Haematococcus lacustris]|uniref:Uncharacterized protein n=1 Tax=Haematococcus lacustris TaxID=44745 RepID=A0A6A0ALT1_HAELA|nr:hypothetical protein HaLaN_32926 [Haematococcus lacustris]